jgi:hypothetical protein
MNKLPINTEIRVPGALVRPGQGQLAARRKRSKGLLGPIRLVGKTLILAVEIVEVIGFGLALL